MNRVLAAALFAALAWLAPLAQAADGADGGWQLVSDRNGIQVYRKVDEGARLKTFRGITRFRIENPSALEALLNDYSAIPRWMHFISSGEELSRSSYLQRKLRFTTELPWPLSDRDVVTDLNVVQLSPVELEIRATDDKRAARTDDYLRIPDLTGILGFRMFRETREAEVTYEIVMDPGGNIPAWAANIVLKDTPYFTLLKLRRVVNEAQYQAFRGNTFDYPW